MLTKQNVSKYTQGVVSLAIRASAIIVKSTPIAADDTLIISAYLALVGFANWILRYWLHHKAEFLFLQWVPAYATAAPVFNVVFVTYSVIVLAATGACALTWVLQQSTRAHTATIIIARGCAPFLVIATSAGVLDAPSLLSRLCFLLSIILSIAALLPALRNKSLWLQQLQLPSQKRLTLYLMIPVLLSLGIATAAWYPVELPNDYFEIPDSVMIPDIAQAQPPQLHPVNRDAVINCLIAEDNRISEIRTGEHSKNIINGPLPSCSLNISSLELTQLRESIAQTGSWQVQAGRLLFHHAYIVLPALHMLRYGLLSPIPHLYGIGNTAFHAFLLHLTSPTLTNYFNTFPIAQLVGIFVLALAVTYIAQDLIAFPIAIAIILIALCRVGFEAVQLAPGFNPLRAAGLAVQIASIFWLFRGQSSIRPIGIIVTLAFSIFWNTEFALLGFVGQCIALLSPRFELKLEQRAVYIIGLLTVLAVCIAITTRLEAGFLQPIQASLFGISVPALSLRNTLLFYCLTPVFFGGLVFITFTFFKKNDQAARLSTLPVLALIIIKFLYNPAPVHLYYSLAIMLPFCIPYLVQAEFNSVNRPTYRRIEFLFALCLVLACTIQAISYYTHAKDYRNMMVGTFAQNTWAELGESFITATPSQPIVSRMEAVRAQIKPEDRVLFLSPFDHLMSIYANPKHYCGHFEILTNLATYSLIQSVIECVRHSPHVLVIYDEASQTPCPTGWAGVYYPIFFCGGKKLLEDHNHIILESLKDNLVLVKKIGPLSFYRHPDMVSPPPLQKP